MALNPGLPAPLPKWVKWLIRAGEAGLYVIAESLVDESSEATSIEDLEWRRLVLEWTRGTPVGTTEDKAQISFDLVNITGGQVDASWTAADFTTCEGFFDEWLTTVKAFQTNELTLTAYKWYRMRFREVMTPTHRFAETGPPVKVQAKSVAGSVTASPLPFQVAFSVTEKTGVPKHWGRFYLPGLTTGALAGDGGRWDAGVTTPISNATAELYDDLAGAEFFPCVTSTQSNKVLSGALFGVSEIQVDDIPDVIRRRRARTPLVRKIGAPTA